MIRNKPIYLVLLIALILILSITGAYGQDYDQADFSRIDEAWEQRQQAFDEKWLEKKDALDDRGARVEKELEQAWLRKNEEIKTKWETALQSTQKIWVSYDNELTSRSRVDFENGKIILEVVVPEGVAYKDEKAKGKMKELGKSLLSSRDTKGEVILKNQIQNQSGQIVDKSKTDPFIDREVIPNVVKSQKAYIPDDGIARRKYQVEIVMVPQHIRVRAERYMHYVKTYAEKYNLEPQLILAVIHTESFFNPKAVSSCHAIGLMQIIPRFAGREAYRYIHNQDIILDHEYYFDPENNIEAGCAYLYLLKTNHFKDINGFVKNRYISICGYNWGPNGVAEKDNQKVQPSGNVRYGSLYTFEDKNTKRNTGLY